MPKTTKVITLHTERANYSEAVKSLQEKIEIATREIYANGTEKVLGLSSTSTTKNSSHFPTYVLTAFVLIEVDAEESESQE
jgi:hypothetical protein